MHRLDLSISSTLIDWSRNASIRCFTATTSPKLLFFFSADPESTISTSLPPSETWISSIPPFLINKHDASNQTSAGTYLQLSSPFIFSMCFKPTFDDFWSISTCFSLQMLQFFGPKFWPRQSLVGKTSEVYFSTYFANRNQNLKESWLEIHYLPRYQISGLWLSTTVDVALEDVLPTCRVEEQVPNITCVIRIWTDPRQSWEPCPGSDLPPSCAVSKASKGVLGLGLPFYF